jgi:glycosyltransferase involved in cell wall biosynthesis
MKIKEKKPVKKRKYTILWVGRLTEQKGIDRLLMLIRMMQNTEYRNSIDWHIIGSGELSYKIDNLQKKMKNIYYFGKIPHTSLARKYQQADILLSTSYWESLPYTYLESMASGIPIIAFYYHGVEEMIETKQNGYIVKSSNECIEKIIYLQKNQPFQAKKIKAGADKKFSEEKIYSSFYSFFHNL